MKNYVDAEKLQEYTTKLVAKLKEIFPGPAQAASTVAEMTDESKVYVYTGSETGYTAGNWYYWDGTAWTSGGVYNAVQIETDTTLSESGKAADAKATGDAIAAAKAAVLADLAPAYSTSATYAVGAYVVYNGGLYRCITAISTAEAWTAAHWTAVDLANDVGASLADLKSAITVIDAGGTITETKALTKGRYLSSKNTVGNSPTFDSTDGKYCIIDVGKAKNGGTIKISIDALTSNANVVTLITDGNNIITRKWVTSTKFTLNAETNKYEGEFVIAATEEKIHFSIYGGSSSCTVDTTVSYSLDSVNNQTIQNTSDIASLGADLDALDDYINNETLTTTVTLASGRYLSNSNAIGGTPSKDSSGGKYCIIDTGYALNGGKVKISIDSVTSSATVMTLFTDANNIIRKRNATYNTGASPGYMSYNAETQKYEATFDIKGYYQIYFSIYGGSSTITVEITPREIGYFLPDYYVSSNGSDDNDGTSSSTPLSTIAKAITKHAKNIYLLSDITESVTISADINIFGNGYTIYGDKVLTAESYNSIFRAPYTADSRITACYVDDTTPLTESAAGSDWKGDKYNITCYADDLRLLPVIDVETCETTPNSCVWYDGYWYINATGTRFSYAASGTLINITGGTVSINDTKVEHCYNNLINAANCILELNGCKLIGSVNANCLTVENGKLTARNTECAYSWNDGINTHGRGESTIIDCYCHDCSDDGISQHDSTTGVIIGGEFTGCGKGGISSPINSAKVDIYSAYIHDNSGSAAYGIYASNSSGTTQTFRIWNCVIKDNRIGLKIVGHQALAYGNKLSGNTTDVSTESGGTVTYLD